MFLLQINICVCLSEDNFLYVIADVIITHTILLALNDLNVLSAFIVVTVIIIKQMFCYNVLVRRITKPFLTG